ncbi:MAG: Amidohydrolase [Solirubrobacterales bacterium]|nr:Amidohydrolase [Solirubrobacterales bacterium]
MPGIVDIHGHITHPDLFKRFPMPPSLLDIEGMLDRKSALGIDTTVVGSPVGFGTMMPVPGLDNYAQPLDQLASFHEWLASEVEKHRPRLAAYVYLNPLGGDAELEQAAQTARDGPFVGLIVNTSVQGRYLDVPEADDFFGMADELGMPILLHPPAEPVGSSSVGDFRLVEQVGRFLDVTMCLATLVFSGRLEQCPNLRLIAATAGGAIGLLGNRLDSAYAPRHYGGPPPSAASERSGPPEVRGGPGPGAGGPPIARYTNQIAAPPSEYLRKVYFDTANLSAPNQLANIGLTGADRLLFGTDSPPLATPLEDCISQVNELPLSEASKERILCANARELFGLD